MSTPIIATKLFVPRPPTNLVQRPQLIEKLHKHKDGKLTLISAPAGFGKTTLLADYVDMFKEPVGWVSLDEHDNDKVRFLKYFIHACQQIKKSIGESSLLALQSQQPLETEILVTGLINEIAKSDLSFFIVLDDYHVITDPEIQQILLFLLDNQPAQLHLTISSRADPPWPLARLRARGEIEEIRVQDLRFTLKEATTFLNELMNLTLSPEDIKTLEKRTDGWAAGLQMAAISLQDQENKNLYVKSFSGSHRFVLDFLMEEVLHQIPDATRDFLLKTSILERLNGSLCDFVLEGENSQSMLRDIEQKNLFLIPLDSHRNWYRYHHLFAELLRIQLNQEMAGLETQLHKRASAWFERQGIFEDAVVHAISAEDYLTAANILEKNVLAMKDIGELPLITKWLQTFPNEIVSSRPWLCVANAWVHAQAGQLAESDQFLSHASTSLATSPSLSKNQINHITGHVLAIEAYTNVYYYKDLDLDQALELANKALALIPVTDTNTKGFVTVLLGTIQRLRLELTPALNTYNSALKIYRGNRHIHETIYTMGELARVYRTRGELHKAVSICEEAIQLARERKNQLLAEAYVLGTLGRISYEWNRLEDAKEISKQAVELSLKLGQLNTLFGNHLLLAKIYSRSKQFSEAFDSIHNARELAGKLSDTHAFYIRAHEATIQLEMGNFEPVKEWIDQLSFQELGDEQRQELAPLIIALFRASTIEHLDEWLVLLVGIQSNCLDKQLIDNWIKITIQYAMALQAMGDKSRAVTTLGQALARGKTEGYMRSFLDQGEPMRSLLQKALSRGIQADYTAKLIQSLDDEREKSPLRKPSPEADLIEPLSDRELEVLRLLKSELSVPEISSHLHISVSTLRTHIRNIYGKLGVHSRFEATTKGRDLGLT